MKRYYWAEPQLGEEEKEAVKEVIESTWIGGNGPKTREFEKEFAKKVDSKYAIAVNNGTSALLAALMAIKQETYKDISALVPTYTFIATATTTQMITDKMDFLDADLKTWNIDVTSVGPGWELIVPVDVGGLPCDYKKIKDLGLIVLEDAAEALGAEYQGKKIGSISDITIFSFHSAKVITTGEGGMITTNDKVFYDTMNAIVNQGYGKKEHPWDYEHERIGLNFRMPELQSAIGLVQLKKLDKFLSIRQEIAKIYKEELSPYGTFQEVPSGFKHAYFFFGILVDPKKRDNLCEELSKELIDVKVTFKPCHLQKPFTNYPANLPNSEYLYKRIISLPIHNNLTDEDAKEIIKRFKESWKRLK